MVLGKLPVRGVLLIRIIVGQRPNVLVVSEGGGRLDIFFLLSIILISPFCSLSMRDGPI